MSQMILEYDEFCMFLLNIEVFNIMTPDFPYTSENETKCTILYKKNWNFKWQDFSTGARTTALTSTIGSEMFKKIII